VLLYRAAVLAVATLFLVPVSAFASSPRVAALQVDGPLPWFDVARLMADGQLVEAANLLDQLGDLSLAAETRMVALRRLAADGRKAEIAQELPKVLTFYRSVGATRYVREAETLLPSVA